MLKGYIWSGEKLKHLKSILEKYISRLHMIWVEFQADWILYA